MIEHLETIELHFRKEDGDWTWEGTSGELIRCKDCLYWRNYCRVVNGVTSHHVCGCKRELDGAMHRSKANDFCSWAKRRKE